MHSVSRFLSRREKHSDKRKAKDWRSKSRQSQHVPSDLYKIFTADESKAATDKDVDKKVKALMSRSHAAGIRGIKEEHVLHALDWYPDNLDEAWNLVVLVNESMEGELKDFNTNITMQGAVNRSGVTCYLDALLFAMFARLDSFEAILYDNFDDEPRKQLAAALRCWVNLLRTGQLIQTSLTKRLQELIAASGWEEAAMLSQQDASEAFTFITGALELPLLTLKMDIYHTGREDKDDDHKFVNERLLEVAIPEQEGQEVITLEDCLETYFNNRIEVKRFLRRQNTMSAEAADGDPEKNSAIFIESVEVAEPESPMTSVRPSDSRPRTDSIFGQRYAKKETDNAKFDEKKHLDDLWSNSSGGRPRSASQLRKEVLMPAWQFFSLIPWYTDNVPSTDAQVAAHFSARRPVLGICLKRYTMLPDGTPKRLNTYIDIPLEIALPHFVSDDRMREEGPLFGNFKLVLQSVVCHRGVSVDSGHYISLVRANLHDAPESSQSDDEAEDGNGAWLRFDDMATPRIANINIKNALCQESPYLLFYQVQPIDEELASRGDPPSYSEAQSGNTSIELSREPAGADTAATGDGDGAGPVQATLADKQSGSVSSEEPAGRVSNCSNRPNSVASVEFETLPDDLRGRTKPHTPDEQKNDFLSVSRRGSRTWLPGNKSRPTSQSGEGRLSITLSKLTGRGSKDKLVGTVPGTPDDPVITISEPQDAETDEQPSGAVEDGKDTTGTQGKSKKEMRERFRSKSRDGDKPDKGKRKQKGKQPRPERECRVM